jgi:hypothetical protein
MGGCFFARNTLPNPAVAAASQVVPKRGDPREMKFTML